MEKYGRMSFPLIDASLIPGKPIPDEMINVAVFSVSSIPLRNYVALCWGSIWVQRNEPTEKDRQSNVNAGLSLYVAAKFISVELTVTRFHCTLCTLSVDDSPFPMAMA